MSSQLPEHPDSPSRLQDLQADAALCDLDPIDAGELHAAGALANPFAETVAAASAALIPPAPLPAALAERIASAGVVHVRDVARWRGGGNRPWKAAAFTGWAVAAAACAIITFLALRPAPRLPEISAAKEPLPVLREKLLARAGAVQADWKPMDAAKLAAGDVVWSDADQAGVMRFANLPVNDPSAWQYQLWIFDATRDQAFPIDGGVFDSTTTAEQLIDIHAKIHVDQAVTFAVTIERPGGVVVSKREKLAALAPVKAG